MRDITDQKRAEETLERLLARMKLLFDASVRITSQTNMDDLLTTVAETARELAGARYCAAGHGYINGRFITGGAAHSEAAMPCPPGQILNVEHGGVYMDLIEKSESLCLADAHCVEEALEIFISVARFKGLDLTLSMTEDLQETETFVGDQGRLRQVLTSLVGNAVKFTEQGKVEVKVEADWPISRGRLPITFTVTDTGIGVSPDKRGLLFKMFSQVDTSNTRSYGGRLGLGLSISKEIVDRMGGTISFKSKEGVGSSFTFTVPLGVVETGNDTSPASGPETMNPGQED